MEAIHSIKVNGRACCAVGDEVWVAKQSGGIAVFAARSGNFLLDIEVKGSDAERAQVTHVVAVFDEVWVATAHGDVHFYNAARHRCDDTLHLPGAEKKVPVVALCMSEDVVAIATGSGSVYVHHPTSHKRLATLSTAAAPCTAAAPLCRFVVGGDAKGGLYVWNPRSGACLFYHGASTSEVVALLHEPATGTVWVSRTNENIDVYALGAEGLTLQRRVSGLGKVTSMTAVSATVLATTFTKRVVQIDAATARVLAPQRPLPSPHTSFIHGCCRTMRQEVAEVWTIGNDGAAQVWRVTGKQVPAVPVPTLSPAAQAALTTSASASATLAENELRVEVQTERQRRIDMVEDLRKSREEAQELRLRLVKKEESWRVVEAELAAERKLRKELEERNAKLTKDVTDITSKVSAVERERSTLQSEVTQLKTDVSNANASVNTKQTEKAAAEQQLSQEKTNKSTLEQRLCDTEAKLTALQSEHRRLCESTGTAVKAPLMSKEAQENLMKNSATLVRDLEQARRMNQLMSSAMASMEYTIRRREEEDKDLTALLNAYRRRVADRLSDAHLSELLLATIVRNAPRFDLECDAFTKAQLMDRNGPFLQFIQSLRLTDPEAYEKLIQYLQNPSAVENMNADAQELLDRFVALAAKDGEVAGEDIVSFKRSIPGLVDGASAMSATAAAAANAAGAAGTTPSSLATLLQNNLFSNAKTGAGEGGALNSTADGGLSRQDQAVVNSAVIRELRGQHSTDESYIREQQAMFEFILKTRRLLVESLALLHKRTVGARQVVEALCVNTAAVSPSVSNVPTPRKSQQPLQKIFSGIICELDSLATEVVQCYLTSAEKLRLGIAS
ncbi:hypothetical protein ABB37_09250 [Leptomonas pyrrhocoris]|uniref:Guanine nucleotide-binding protein subunit beta-like protein n=1 Tax=Leptomonas pyrrhocoris TaxID=157538 RepID=A0A0M9FR87_LEPPY|nr:hypothetical protein ABB37_09250 [Leptomonas pyrrhocoris]KPA74236.1 hypothetical protein ABB37_09250 [Leptomonas pyrrhocoris]|eukprot:XP_015652675.1 hypothetical protein ABB37_09250 [Leptomonas pyrrhocoris]